MSELRQAKLIRSESDDQGTFGLLSTDSGFSCYVGELPFRDNAVGKSCIPSGKYLVQFAKGEFPKHPEVYAVRKVEGRDAILIHSGNFVGDIEKGLKANAEGCLLPGRALGEIGGQKAVLSSKDALAALVADLEEKDFILEIQWAPGREPGATA